MDIYEHIEAMNAFIMSRKWDELENEFRHVAENLAGLGKAQAIAEVNLSRYQELIGIGLDKAVIKARQNGAKAIYFEYDLDNGWSSNFFICPTYNPASEGDEDWACDWSGEVRGPSNDALAQLYIPGFDKPQEAKGSTLYLVARTIAAFGRCATKYDAENFAICIGFHDQTPVMRIKD